MVKTVLQVPMDLELRQKAEREAIAQGFSSLQEAVRVFLKKLAAKALSVTYEETEEVVQLSPKAIKKYNKMIDEIDKGKVKTVSFTDVDSLMKHLNK